ncbi:MAG: peptidylprolyl isomerase, partial [Syntrophothermus sp.]
MAIIGRIRKHSGLAVILVGVAIAAFVIGDFGKKNARRSNDIGKVDGENITYTEYSNKVEEAITAQKENSGSDKISDEETYSIRTSTWNTLVKDLIMEKELDKLGLTVTPEELFDQVQGKNPHRFILQYFKDPKTGMYDPAIVMNYLKNLNQMEPKAKSQWLRFEQAIKQDRLDNKFNNLIAKAYYVPKEFLKRFSKEQNEKMIARIIAPGLTSVSDSAVKLTDADYEAYYKENIAYFKQDEETRDADYVVFEVTPSTQDRQKIADETRKMYDEMLQTPDIKNYVNANSDVKYDSTFKKKGSFPGQLDSVVFKTPVNGFIAPFEFNNNWYMGKIMDFQDRPDTIKGAQILISYSGSPLGNKEITRTKAQAKSLADSLATVLRKNLGQFKPSAIRFSDYPTAKDDAGDLKEIIDGQPNFAIFFNEAKGMKVNDLKVVETPIGYSVFYLTYRGKIYPKVRVAVLQRAIEPSNQTFQDVYLKANTFAGQNRTIDAFTKSATAQGLQIQNGASMRQMDNFVMGLPAAREIVRWAYNEETKVGDVSQVFDLNGKYVVAALKGITEAGVIPLEKVKDRLQMAVLNDKKCGVIYDKLKNSLKGRSDLYGISQEVGAKVDTVNLTFGGFSQSALGREFAIIGDLFTRKAPSFVGAVKGKYGAYVIQIDQIVPAPPKDDYMQENMQMSGNFVNRVTQSLFESM